MAAFREEVAKSKHIVVLTGAGASAESGVPTFRGAGGLWRKWNAQVCSPVSHFTHISAAAPQIIKIGNFAHKFSSIG